MQSSHEKERMPLPQEERRHIFNALLTYRNKLISRDRYTDLVEEIIIKLQK